MQVTVRLSESAQAFLAGALDLIEAVENADPALVTDEILAANAKLQAVVDERRGEL